MKRHGLVLAAVLAGSMVGADCDGNVVQDPTFRDWCGANLCAWTTDFGSIQRAPTWNENDYGVSFLDSPDGTQISQVTTENQARCLLFTSVGDIDPAAQMTISADFDSDGTVDFTAPLGSATWHKVETEITAPAAYQGVTFHITKNGKGTAVLAEMTIKSWSGCTASAAPAMKNLRLGEACASTTECGAGLVCASPGQGAARLCSECDALAPCSGNESCASRSVFLPLQCAPGQSLGKPGAPCLAANDCASGACNGAEPVSLVSGDAGPCDFGAIGDFNPNDCAWYAAIGGTCQ